MKGDTLAGRFRLEGRLGQGGFSEVWRATDLDRDATVALKLPRPGMDLSVDWAAAHSLEAEADALERMGHRCAVQLLERGADNGRPFLVMEYLEGPSLDSALRQQTFNDDSVIRTGAALADCLEHAHSQGVVHGDVKPGNIILTDDGPKLTDFGTARDIAETMPPVESRKVIGTLSYLAPEILNGAPATPSTDVYALAVTLFEARTGRLPFGGGGAGLAPGSTRTLTPLRSLDPAAGARLESVLSAALAAEPRERPASAGAFAEQLLAAASRPDGAAPGEARRRGAHAIAWLPPRHPGRALVRGSLAGLILGSAGAVALVLAGPGADQGGDEPQAPRGPASYPALTGFPLPASTAQPVPPQPTAAADDDEERATGEGHEDGQGGGDDDQLEEDDASSGPRGNGKRDKDDDGPPHGQDKPRKPKDRG